MAARVVVFLDFQNVYRRARPTFCTHGDPAYAGQVDPFKLGELIIRRDAPGPMPRTCVSAPRTSRGAPAR